MKSKATPEHGKGVVRGKSKGRKSKGNPTRKKKKRNKTRAPRGQGRHCNRRKKKIKKHFSLLAPKLIHD